MAEMFPITVDAIRQKTSVGCSRHKARRVMSVLVVDIEASARFQTYESVCRCVLRCYIRVWKEGSCQAVAAFIPD